MPGWWLVGIVRARDDTGIVWVPVVQQSDTVYLSVTVQYILYVLYVQYVEQVYRVSYDSTVYYSIYSRVHNSLYTHYM